ncbi:hypothetical protein RhiirA4_415153 [Rhizophagus irregularis]|uniref:Uncharacterized protein n=1 Tax=Rhizophagus irregularis TaxID=588596 RepID=A0A2I1FYY4_9GLOM|nr:hypothetical protein RhiirA4_415153 [Rhizophagus irregularis]
MTKKHNWALWFFTTSQIPLNSESDRYLKIKGFLLLPRSYAVNFSIQVWSVTIMMSSILLRFPVSDGTSELDELSWLSKYRIRTSELIDADESKINDVMNPRLCNERQCKELGQ